MRKGPYVPITVRLPPDVHRDLLEVAREQRRSLNTAIIVAVERYVRQMTARRPRDSESHGQ